MANLGIDPITGAAIAGPAATGVASLIDSVASLFNKPDTSASTAAIRVAQINAAEEATAATTRSALVVTMMVGAGALLVGGLLLYGAVTSGNRTRKVRR